MLNVSENRSAPKVFEGELVDEDREVGGVQDRSPERNELTAIDNKLTKAAADAFRMCLASAIAMGRCSKGRKAMFREHLTRHKSSLFTLLTRLCEQVVP